MKIIAQRGIVGVALIIIVAIVAIMGGAYVYTQQDKTVENSVSSDTNTIATIENDLSKAKNETNRKASKEHSTSSVVTDSKIVPDIVSEKYGSNSTYVRNLIKVRLQAIGAGFFNEAREFIRKDENYSHNGVCDLAKPYFVEEVNKAVRSGGEFGDETNAKLKITAESYRINEIECKSTEESFIATIPLTLEDGKDTKLCIYDIQGYDGGTAVGKADFNTMKCIGSK